MEFIFVSVYRAVYTDICRIYLCVRIQGGVHWHMQLYDLHTE